MSAPPNPNPESPADYAHSLVRGALGAIPLAGGLAVELFNAVITPPLERRRRTWMESIGNALNEMQQKIEAVDIDRLAEDEEFITLLTSASQLALKTHRQEKLNALRYAVLNSACGRRPSEDIQATFLALIDRFTPLHLQLLHIFDQGYVWSNDNHPVPDDPALPPMLVPSIGSYGELLQLDRAVLKGALRDLIANELIQQWIVDAVTEKLSDGSFSCAVKQWKGRSAAVMRVIHGVAIGVDARPGSYVTRTTHLGRGFIRFVSRPAGL